MTEPMRVSNSSIQSFKRCRRKWWLTYSLGWTPHDRAIIGPLALGSRVHKALEAMYVSGEDPVRAHARLVEAERESLLLDYADIDKLESDAELGRIMLEGYVDWVEREGLDDGLEIIGVEQKLELPLLDNKVLLIGKMDLRAKNADNVRSVLDFKTSASFSDYDLVHLFEQGPTYWVLDRATDASDRIEAFTLRLLKKVKRTARATPPFYEQFHVRFNPFTMRSFWSRLHGTLHDMVQVQKALDRGDDPLTVVYPTPKRDCRWDCNFAGICGMFDDGSAVQQALEDNFEQADPFAYYGNDEEKES